MESIRIPCRNAIAFPDLKEIQFHTVAHYLRMIEWAMIQTGKKDYTCASKMLDDIGENWYGNSCPYCVTFNNIKTREYCYPCPLGSVVEKCCAGLWWGLQEARNWNEWIKAAEKVMWQIIYEGGIYERDCREFEEEE